MKHWLWTTKLVSGLLCLGSLTFFFSPGSAAGDMPAGLLDEIAQKYPNGLPRYMTPEEQEWLDEQGGIEALSAAEIGLLAAPAGLIWSPGEYEPVYGPLIAWEPSSYRTLLTNFIIGVTTDPCMDSLAFVIVADPDEEASCISTLEGAGADTDRLKFIHYDLDTVWIRDYGPRYIGEDGFPAIIDHTYNRPRYKDNAFPTFVRTYNIPFAQNEPIYEMDLTHGGGNFHSVSTGDAFMSTLILDENSSKSTLEITNIIESHFNVSLTIYPRLSGTVDATGHIDMWLLPLSDNKILVSEFQSDHPNSKTITDDAAADLQSRGYTVYRTGAYNSTGEGSSGGTHYTYTNATIVNNRVFIPWYNHTSEDGAALSVFQTALPDHEIIQLDCRNIIPAAGAIHCVMKHVYVPTTPFAEVLVPNGGETWDMGQQYEIKWIANDDIGITSVDIYYSTNGGTDWQLIAAGEPHDGYYAWTIPDAPSAECQLKVVVHDGHANSREDTSDSNFQITSPDLDPPTPATMTWDSLPAATGQYSISMTATIASDPSGVEYFFACTAGGGNDSGWQDDPIYEDTGLTPSTTYSYQVQARDKSPAQNATSWSTEQSARTDAPPPALPWSDDFESEDLLAGGWSVSGNVSASSKAAYAGSAGAEIKATSSIAKSISTAGFTSIRIRYVRQTTGLDSGEFLYVEWYDGATWHELEPPTQEADWVSKDLTCPSGADDNVDFILRFRTNASNASETAYVDNVEITGQTIPTTLSISGTVACGTSASGVNGVLLNGLPGAPVSTNSQGQYTAVVNYGWTGTVTPTKQDFSFLPGAESYTDVTLDQVDQDYTGIHAADLSGDCFIDLLDLAQVGQHWLSQGAAGLPGDVNLDGKVSLADVAKITQHWLCDCSQF